MLTKRVFHLVVLVLLLCPALAAAFDPPPGRWWRLPKATERLKLSEDQKSRLDSLFEANRLNLIELKGSVEKEQFKLRNLLEAETLDERAAEEQFKKLQAARATMDAERFRYFLEVRKILGYQKFQMLEIIYREFRERLPHRDAPGGMRPPE
jgi:Spy/CpxP family protein refolding chaperone